MEYLRNLHNKVFWPVLGCYIVYLCYKLIEYFYGMKNIVDKELFDAFYKKIIIGVSVLIVGAIIFRLCGHSKIAGLFISLPLLILAIIFLFVSIALIYMAISAIFSK